METMEDHNAAASSQSSASCYLESILMSSMRGSKNQSNLNKNSNFTQELLYSSDRMSCSDRSNQNDFSPTNDCCIDSMNSENDSCIQKYTNHSNNSHCQRTLLPADSVYLHHQHHNSMNEDELNSRSRETRNRSQLKIEDQQKYSKNKECNIEDRSLSPASSSDIAEILTSVRQQSNRYREHSLRRYKNLDSEKDNNYHDKINSKQNNEHKTGMIMHRQGNYCHRYHEIGQSSSCSPICDSGIRSTIDDDRLSSVPSNYRGIFSSCEDIYGRMCSPTSVTETVTSSTISPASNMIVPLPIQTITNEHHRMSSGISCESSTSLASIKHHGTVERCVTKRHQNHQRHNYTIQPYALDHSNRTLHAGETKSSHLIGLESIQV